MESVSIYDTLKAFENYISKADIYESNIAAKIANLIIDKRLEMDMSQKQFAKFMGVSQGLISRWEDGSCNFTIKTLANIAEKLKVTVDILFEPETLSFNRQSYVVNQLDTIKSLNFKKTDDSKNEDDLFNLMGGVA